MEIRLRGFFVPLSAIVPATGLTVAVLAAALTAVAALAARFILAPAVEPLLIAALRDTLALGFALAALCAVPAT